MGRIWGRILAGPVCRSLTPPSLLSTFTFFGFQFSIAVDVRAAGAIDNSWGNAEHV